jgi:ABC-type glycerol-3-phosphate transport system permease component
MCDGVITAMQTPTGAIRTTAFTLRRAQLILTIILILGAVLVIVPFAWIFISSFKPRGEIFNPTSIWVPREMTLDNYRTVLDSPLGTYALNSIIATVTAIVLNLPTGALAAYGFSRFQFRGRSLLLVVLLMSQLLPAAAIVVPLFLQWSRLDWLNSPFSLGLTYAGLTLPLVILLLSSFIDSIPTELDDAAEIDGCSRLNIFWRILVPLLRPGLAASSIFIFVTTWQEFLLALSLATKSAYYTLPVGLFAFQGQFITDWGAIMAMAVVIAIPAVILFTVLQNQFISSITGAVKG